MIGPVRAAHDAAQAARQAGDLPSACRWMSRAHRLAPSDPTIALTYGLSLLEAGAPARAAAVLVPVAERTGSADGWIALAACDLALGAAERCVDALARALRMRVPDAALASLATQVVERLGLPGWCGFDGAGRVLTGMRRASRIVLDGVVIRGTRLPDAWRTGDLVEVGSARGAFVGSPLPLPRFRTVSGVVAAREGGIEGWIWHEADPAHDPPVLVEGPHLSMTLTARDPADGVEGLPPLARPRRFACSAEQVAALGGPLTIRGADGRDLLGSPLDPGPTPDGVPVDLPPRAVPAVGAPCEADIVIPVCGNAAATLACLRSVRASVPAGTVVHVIDDGSPEPSLRRALDALDAAGEIRLIQHARARGFPAAANAGLRAAAGRDAVLLNSDTLLPPGWLARLRRAAYSTPETGSATPLCNDGTIVSVPSCSGPNPMPDEAGVAAWDGWAEEANAGQVAALPVGVGFCLYLRRDCLSQAGDLREDLFAQGYGEENDLCLRARRFGWRHVAALDVFVGHVGGASFGGGRAELRRRNAAILSRLHPGYDDLVAAHVAADPLFEARRRIDRLRWAAAPAQAAAVILVTHGSGGGTAEFIAGRVAALERQGLRGVVLRPQGARCQVDQWPNLLFAISDEIAILAELLRPLRPVRVEIHHLLGHHRALPGLAALLSVPLETWVHDDALFCARIALVDGSRRYCGEPDVAGCVACIAEAGSKLGEDVAVPALLAGSAALLAGSDRVVVPTNDAAMRLRRHFPGIVPTVEPWEDDGNLPPLASLPAGKPVRVCVVGAIGVEKGYDVLLACVGDAAARRLPLEFVVCGHTEDDTRLLAAGPVFITGPYDPAEAVALVRESGAHLALIPSIWPELWCFALSRAWQAGLRVVAFDLGAQAERIRGSGRGVLLPLGLPAARVNDALLRLAPPWPALHRSD